MSLGRVHLALRRKEVKGSDLQIVHITNGPAVPTVRPDVLIDATMAFLKLLQHVPIAIISSGFFSEDANRGGKRLLGCDACWRVLMPQQVLRFAGPRHNLRV